MIKHKRPVNQTKAQLQKAATAHAAATGCKSKQAKIELGLAAIAEARAQIAEEQAERGLIWTVLNLGMGVDSTAILLRVLNDGFEAHGIDPEKFVVITAQTGGEYEDLGQLIDEHIAPRLKAAGVRWVQVARSSDAPGSTIKFTLLGDTAVDGDYTTKIEGDYPLRDEYVGAGTIIQSGGDRLCSIKAKGYPLDAWLRANIPADEPYRQIIGFESEEVTRAFGDVHQGDENRRPEYPLIEWGWDRKKCIAFIKEQTGACWGKSACYFCPYAGQGAEKHWVAKKWAEYPELAADVLMMERTGQALNERQTLLGGRSPDKAWDQGTAIKFAQQNGLGEVLSCYERRLAEMAWAVYQVRRVWSGPSNAIRSVVIVSKGTREEAEAHVAQIAAEHGVELERKMVGHDIVRTVVKGKPADGKGAELMFAASPMTMTENKTPVEDFDARFTAAGGATTNWGADCGCLDDE